MSSLAFSPLDTAPLFQRLASGERVCVVTPNQRLAAALAERYARAQLANGLEVWDAADILPLSALYQRYYDAVAYSGQASMEPSLLTAIQEQAIWEGIIAGSEAGAGLLSASSAATLARDAWTLAHAWHLLPKLNDFFGNEDTRVFSDWAWRYQGSTARDKQIDRARLADWLLPQLSKLSTELPRLLVAWGFEILTPQQEAFFAAMGGAGIKLSRDALTEPQSSGVLTACADPEEEMRHAARCRPGAGAARAWARSSAT